HADDVIAGIDVMDLAGHGARHVGEEIDCGLADLVDRDRAAERRVELVPFQDVAEIADAGSGQRLDRPGRDGVDADVLGAEIGGEEMALTGMFWARRSAARYRPEASSAALATPITL